MRLVCPNCGAQYEIDDRVMPEAGRDVQCSSCGHGWFHVPTTDQTPEPPAVSPFVDIAPKAEEPDPEEVDDVADQVDEAEAPARPARKLDDSVRDILQAEAERELSARSAEQSSIETQADLGLDSMSDAASDQDKDPVIDTRDEVYDEPAVDPSPKGREALPDIEEINSTLDAPEDDPLVAPEIAPDAPEVKSGGFRRGFVLVVVIACLLAILYIMAPTIGERVPALQPFMEQYIEVADRVRVALEDTMRMAISKMQGLIEKPEGS